MAQQILIAPSILAANFGCLVDEVKRVANAPWIHIDVMDNHFVPNLSFGLPVAQSLVGVSAQHLDVHLMIEDPSRWALAYAKDFHSVTFHLEAVADIDEALELAAALRAAGTLAGISVKPGTPIDALLPHVEAFDLVLVMSVEPGFGGQAFMPEVLGKVRALREVIDARGLATLIEIDGGIGEATAVDAAAAGVDVFVAGSSVFGAEDPAAAVDAIRIAAMRAANIVDTTTSGMV